MFAPLRRGPSRPARPAPQACMIREIDGESGMCEMIQSRSASGSPRSHLRVLIRLHHARQVQRVVLARHPARAMARTLDAAPRELRDAAGPDPLVAEEGNEFRRRGDSR